MNEDGNVFLSKDAADGPIGNLGGLGAAKDNVAGRDRRTLCPGQDCDVPDVFLCRVALDGERGLGPLAYRRGVA